MSDTYDELYKRIADAHNKMLENRVRANTVIINGRKYGMLGATIEESLRDGYTPTIVGLSADVTCGLPDDFDFVVMERNNPPKSEFEKLQGENKRLKEKLAKIASVLDGDFDE